MKDRNENITNNTLTVTYRSYRIENKWSKSIGSLTFIKSILSRRGLVCGVSAY